MRRTLTMFLMTLMAATTLFAQPAAIPEVQTIPAHPTKLLYEPLEFDVPDENAYRHTLSNGVVVYVAEDNALPLVRINIALRAGAFLDPSDKPGLAGMTGTMMRRGGTTSMSAEDFDERADFLAAGIGSSSGLARSSASLDCITPVLDESLSLLFDMLRNPGFQQDRIDVERDNLLESMKQRNDRPQSISGREWGWLFRGKDHFASRVQTAAELESITREDMIQFHRKYWQPANMIIAVSGDVDTKQALGMLEKRFKGWKNDGPKVAWPPSPPKHTPVPGVYYVDKDIPQGRVLIGHLGLQRKSWNDPDTYAIEIMNDILGGGGFSSRLVKRIRSDEGLAYSAFSGFGIGEFWPGIFRMGYQSKSATVAFAAQIAREEMQKIREKPVSEEELATAKASFVDVFPRRYESAEDIVSQFVDNEYDGRPNSYWETYRDRITAVNVKDVQRAAKKYLDPEKLVYLIVGKWDEIAPGDPDGRASMKDIRGGEATQLPLRDPMTLEPL